jgi:hypothetical protein
MMVILNLIRESICQPRESANLHPHGGISIDRQAVTPELDAIFKAASWLTSGFGFLLAVRKLYRVGPERAEAGNSKYTTTGI